MAGYLILIYEDPQAWAQADAATAQEILEAHGRFQAANRAALGPSDALTPPEAATSIRVGADGELTVTDGPFVETKEALGGFYSIEAADLDEAIAIAKQVPAPFGGVEVRPIRVFS